MPSHGTCHIYCVEGRSDKKVGAPRVPDNSGPIQTVPESSVQCHQGISALLRLCVTPTPNSELRSSSETRSLAPHLCDPAHCTSFPTFRSYPVILICPPIHISFSSIALTLPYLLFPVFPSVMPVFPVLLISENSGHLSDPSGLSLYVHNTFRTWKVLCSLFIQTSSYISSTTPVYFL